MIKIFLISLFLISLSFGHGMSEGEKQIIVEGGNLHYIYVGFVHMLWGYDHLLFVLGIIFFLQTFKDIVKYITAFTIGHSITLIYATFNMIQINYYLIDAIIALSVCLIGLINLGVFKKFIDFTSSKMLGLIFILGLIHGLGLSTRLQQLPLNKDELLLNIISFNIGIELGQIAALCVMLIFIRLIRNIKNFDAFAVLINSFIVIAGAFFFIQQINEYKSSLVIEHEVDKTVYTDTISFTLPAHTDKEYKVWQEPNEQLIFSWHTVSNSVVFFDFHAEKASASNGEFESFKESIASNQKGQRVATFVGTHGWYWKNDSNSDITIVLKLAGEYKIINKH